MALATYTELKTAIADFLNRDDLTSIIPTFIQLAEAQINRDLRHWNMELRSTAAQSTQYGAVPSDWLETIRISVNGSSGGRLQLVSKADIEGMRNLNNDAGGTPKYYAHFGGQFEFYPTPSEEVTIDLLYYGKVPDLAANETSWLLTDAPDVYLYGSLLHTAPYLQDDARLNVWAQMYSAAVQRLNDTSDKGKWSGTGLKMKLRGL